MKRLDACAIFQASKSKRFDSVDLDIVFNVPRWTESTCLRMCFIVQFTGSAHTRHQNQPFGYYEKLIQSSWIDTHPLPDQACNYLTSLVTIFEGYKARLPQHCCRYGLLSVCDMVLSTPQRPVQGVKSLNCMVHMALNAPQQICWALF